MTLPLHSLPLEQQSRHYRELAAEAFRTAREATTPDRKAEYMRLALGWHSMAQDVEAKSSHLEAAVEKRRYRPKPKQQN